MKKSSLSSFAVAALLAVGLQALPAIGAVVVGNVVSGTVTGVSGYQITVSGQTYTVERTGNALSQLQQVQSGEQVDLVLNGPPGAASTEVVAIHVHTAS